MEVPEGTLMSLAMSDPAQDIHSALTPCQQLQEPPAPLAAREPKQATAPVIGVAEGHRQSPLSVEQQVLDLEQQFRLTESPKDGLSSPVIPVFLIFALFMHLFHSLIYSAL